MVVVAITSAATQARLSGLASKLKRPQELAEVIGREAQNRLIDHFREKDRTEPNALGGDRQHFWRQVADSVAAPRITGAGTEVRIAINHPAYRQKLQGGTITAKNKKALTIPVDPKAYGRTAGNSEGGGPGTFEAYTGLHLWLLKKSDGAPDSGMLVAVEDGRLRVFYILRKSVTQDPDPTALPPRAEFEQAIIDRAESFTRRAIEADQGGAS